MRAVAVAVLLMVLLALFFAEFGSFLFGGH